MSKCQMNCNTCDYKRHNGDGYCYMWREEPSGVCHQHTGYKRFKSSQLVKKETGYTSATPSSSDFLDNVLDGISDFDLGDIISGAFD